MRPALNPVDSTPSSSLQSSSSNLLRQNPNPMFAGHQRDNEMENLCEHGRENSEKAQDLARIIMQNYSRYLNRRFFLQGTNPISQKNLATTFNFIKFQKCITRTCPCKCPCWSWLIFVMLLIIIFNNLDNNSGHFRYFGKFEHLKFSYLTGNEWHFYDRLLDIGYLAGHSTAILTCWSLPSESFTWPWHGTTPLVSKCLYC